MKKHIFTGAIFAMALFALPVQGMVITTPFDTNNNNFGIFFDVEVGANNVTFEAFTVSGSGSLINTDTADWSFYRVDGGIAGNFRNPAAWTLIDTFPGIASNGTALLSFDITDFTATANSTVGFYIERAGPPFTGLGYANGGPVGSVRATDGNLTILTGYGSRGGFNNDLPQRDFVGSITYSVAPLSVPAPSVMLLFGFGILGVALRRRIVSSLTPQLFTLNNIR